MWLKWSFVKGATFCLLFGITVPIFCVVFVQWLTNRAPRPFVNNSIVTYNCGSLGIPAILEMFVCTHKHVLHTHTHTGLPEQRLIFSLTLTRALSHTHTHTHTHRVMLIRVLSQLHLGQTKHAASNDSVSTMAITFLVIFCPITSTNQGECLVLFTASPESLVSHQIRPNYLVPFLISVSYQVSSHDQPRVTNKNRNSLNSQQWKASIRGTQTKLMWRFMPNSPLLNSLKRSWH